ncbi:SPFH domain-containing protein [Streptomyces sp. RB6PN25]|uniref:SPFH domain-containing protein n=1 Tax=Streptomyces humicola TaxID=2953240 RepID=A0ABT1Q1X0_9ACTN|nr:SPFH domain-containing protein [Streptomyces humicola]MCQ4083907.1 SPFH domain-containing protein [Streptomyces humicola]
MDPVKSIVEIEDVSSAIGQITRTAVRNVVGRSLLDQVFTDSETINEQIKEILDGLTRQWGVYVLPMELKDIELPLRDSVARFGTSTESISATCAFPPRSPRQHCSSEATA